MGQDLINEINDTERELFQACKSLETTSREYGIAYAKYRMLLAQELVKLRDEGMAVTLISDIARGKSEIAKAKFKEIEKEGLYFANRELVNCLKKKIDILKDEASRQWIGAKNE